MVRPKAPQRKPATAYAGGRAGKRRESGRSSGGWPWGLGEWVVGGGPIVRTPSPPLASRRHFPVPGWGMGARRDEAAGPRGRAAVGSSRRARAQGAGCVGSAAFSAAPRSPERVCGASPSPSLPGTGFGVRHFPVSFLAAIFAFYTFQASQFAPFYRRLGLVCWFSLFSARFHLVLRWISGILSLEPRVLRTSLRASCLPLDEMAPLR